MYSYVACVWNDKDVEARSVAHRARDQLLLRDSRWQVAAQASGLLVLYRSPRLATFAAHLLHEEGAGVVLGTLFRRSSAVLSTAISGSLDSAESERIVRTGGRHLIDRYWGRYVAVLRDPSSGAVWVLRDPAGGLRCLTRQNKRVNFYWSRMEDAVELGLGPFRVNWPYIHAMLLYAGLQVSETGLREVSQVRPGECVRLHQGCVERTLYWDPLLLAKTSPIEDFSQATKELQQSTQMSVSAWASCYDAILLTLSGGLDSSIVLACLSAAPSKPRITCVNHYSPGSDSDERKFAQIAACHAKYELIERRRDSTVSLKPMLNVRRTCTPMNCLYWIDNASAESVIATYGQDAAVFSGFGGDQLFYSNEAIWSVADFLQRRSPRPALLRTAVNAARMDRVSVWSVLHSAFVHGLLRRPPDFLAGVAGKKLLSPSVIDAVRGSSAFLPPWYESAERAPPGKVWQALQTMIPWDDESPLSLNERVERIAPLYSQPLLEVCMRIPTYFLACDGWDRVVARRAFQDRVPREIINRKTKGGLEEHLKSVLKHNLPLVRQLILEGELVRERSIDRRAIERALSPDAIGITAGTMEWFEYLNIEAWLRRWREAGST